MISWFKHRKVREQELERELAYHLAKLAEENRDDGQNPADAHSGARRQLGNATLIKERMREVWRWSFADQCWQDLRYAFRSLHGSPAFTIIAILTLGLAIGANTAIFSVLESVLFRQLPYPDPSRLVLLSDPQDPDDGGLLYQDYQAWKAQTRTFDALAIYYRDSGWSRITLTGQGEPQTVQGAFVSANFFSVMGVRPLLGRSFTPEEEALHERIVVLSHALWTSRFGRSPDVIGQSLQIDAADSQIIGVMPATFQFPGSDSTFWVPITTNRYWHDPALLLNDPNRSLGFYTRWQAVGRLRSGLTTAAAQHEMDTLAKRLAQRSPNAHRPSGIAVLPLRIKVGGNTRLALAVLFAAVCLVLLIACSNVANLVLARGAAREREISVRIALGAGRRRILGQLLTENLLLTALSASFGIALAAIGIRLLITLAPPGISRLNETRLDLGVLVFALFIAALSFLLFGLVPAWKTSQADPHESLKSATRGMRGSNRLRALRSLFVIAEFSLAVVLLSGAGLLLRSFLNLRAVDPGFRPDHILSMHITLPANSPAGRAELLDEETLARARAIPGVRAVGAVGGLFSNGAGRNFALRIIEGRAPERLAQWKPLAWTTIRGDYFQAMGTRLLNGRFFSDRDAALAPLVAIINQNLARRYWPNENPVGKRFKGFDRRGIHDDWITVIGVVEDMRTGGLEKPPAGEIFQWYRQSHESTPDLVVRTSGDPNALAGTLRGALRSLDQIAILSAVSTVEQELTEQLAPRNFETWLVGVFSLLALILASVGIYGVIHYSVTQRIGEIGIRMALGAHSRSIQRLVLSEALHLAAVGLGFGLLGSFALNRLLASLLYGVGPADPLTFICVSTLLLLTAILASFVPARRAAAVDPLTALRQE
jgi:putative ABC transport system permease protein